jgi:hypothetical protein
MKYDSITAIKHRKNVWGERVGVEIVSHRYDSGGEISFLIAIYRK